MANTQGTLKSILNNRKTINGWAMFDWANSAYALVITVAIFPIYFLEVTPNEISIFGSMVPNSAIYAYSISVAYILIAVLTPLFSGIADSSGKRMAFLKFFTYLGGIACISLFAFSGSYSASWVVGIIAFMLATIGFTGGLVFYNAYLPDIASEDQYDKVSAKGFAMGYIGSVLLLIVNLFMIEKPGFFGIEEGSMAARISFVMVGLWWIGFAQIPFKRLPKGNINPIGKSWLTKGYHQINKVVSALKNQGNILRFLASFFFYSAGVQTVLYLAATFAEKELSFGSTELILLVLILQLVAIGGAYLFAWVSRLRGNKFSLLFMLTIWVIICIAAYFVTDKIQFYLIGALVGIVMGGTQSLSRSTYSKLIPLDAEDRTSYFSFYDVLEKLAIVGGTFSFGFIEHLTGGMRNSIVALGVFFVMGMIFLAMVKVRHAVVE